MHIVYGFALTSEKWDGVVPAQKFVTRVGNIYFLARIGSTLRWATQDIAKEELPPEVAHLLRRLDRVEAKANHPKKSEREPG